MTARHRDDGCVGVVERLDQQNLEAGLDKADDGRRDRLRGTHGDQHFGVGVVADAEVALALCGLGLRHQLRGALSALPPREVLNRHIALVHPGKYSLVVPLGSPAHLTIEPRCD